MQINIKIILTALIICFLVPFAKAQSSYDGKTISSISIKTSRIHSSIAKRRFLLKEGEIFSEQKYEEAKQSLHDMRIFKTIDFSITENSDDSLSIDIDAKDGYFVFPFLMATGGASNAFAVMLMETNLFKFGEFSMLTGAFSNQGYAIFSGLGINRNFFNINFNNMDYSESVFENGSYSNSGLFSPSSKNEFSSINEYRVKRDSTRLSWARPLSEHTGFSLGFDFNEINYFGDDYPDDKGSHNKIVIGLNSSKNMRAQGGGLASIGAIFGLGVSDLKEKFTRLKETKYGYSLSANYENGNRLTDSDFYISKLHIRTGASIELKNRNIFNFNLSAGNSFSSPFSDYIKSGEVLTRGDYSREFRGEQAVGTGISFVQYLLKSKSGFATFSPFIEDALIINDGIKKNMTGAGLGFSYMFWKFPFPFGIKYTHNVTDGSYNISALFGGSF